jgi:hypothetical protein
MPQHNHIREKPTSSCVIRGSFSGNDLRLDINVALYFFHLNCKLKYSYVYVEFKKKLIRGKYFLNNRT